MFLEAITIKELCIASGNPGKLYEIQQILNDFGLTIHSQADFNIKPATETGCTFAENAIIKARHAAQLSHLPTISDDSGLCIDVLNQDPGVKASSYAGENATTEDNIQKVLISISPYRGTTIKARAVTVICFMRNSFDLTPLLITEILEGELLHEARGQTRGYDSIFFLPELGKTMGELSIYEKNRISARGRAIIKLKQHFESCGAIHGKQR